MIVQCAWCGVFMGEKPPYRDKAITHGMCMSCFPVHRKLSSIGTIRVTRGTREAARDTAKDRK